MSLAIVWFRRDLRLEDNPALTAAIRAHERVICVYIHAPAEEAPWIPGAASRWWLHHSLAALDAALRKRGTQLQIRCGATPAQLDALIRETGAAAVYWNRLYEPAIALRDTQIKQALLQRAIAVESFNANLLVEPWEMRTGQGGPYRVFTPFWRQLRARLLPQPPTAAPRRIASIDCAGGTALEALQLLPKHSWGRGLHDRWKPGARGAGERLKTFFGSALATYAAGRDRPDRDGTSSLSPHLHFGEIGPRQIVWSLQVLARSQRAGHAHEAADAFVRELAWREFSQHMLYHFPHTPERNLNAQFDAFPWAPDGPAALANWQRGRTGIPIVDAGMRQLWKTGWMHNRVRMIVASFLTKNLRQQWRHGARWFWDTLVDADLANNTQGWQWSAGCGADAAPYFRIFNPVSQGQRFDPNGDYVRHWVAELADVPAPLIHQPWTDPALLQTIDYPAPIIDLRASREAALQAYRQMRGAQND